MEPKSRLQHFHVTKENLLYAPEDWIDSTGVWRVATRAFSLASYTGVRLDSGKRQAVIPLNPRNLDGLFQRIPDCNPDIPHDLRLAKQVILRAIALDRQRNAMAEASACKSAKGVSIIETTTRIVEETTERVKCYLFSGETGPYFEREIKSLTERFVTQTETTKLLTEWDAYSPPGRSFYYQQRAALELCSKVPKALLAMQQRVGKTPVVATLQRHLRESGEIDVTIIVSTRRLLHTAWWDELILYDPHAEFLIVSNDEQRGAILERDFDCILTTFESLGKNWPLIRRRYDPSRIMLVADETIKIKSPRAQRTQALFAASLECARVYFLSGAPVSRQHGDILPQLCCLDPGMFGDDYNAAWDYFFENVRRGGAIETRFRSWPRDRKTLFYEYEDYLVWRCTRGESEQFTGRETVTQNVRLPFDPLQAMIYKDLARAYYAEYDDDNLSAAVKATNILVMLLRLREICGGFLSYEVEPGIYRRHRLQRSPKLDWLRQYFDEHEGVQSIIFCEFNEEEEIVADLLDELQISYGGTLKVEREGYGGSDYRFAEHVREFQDGERTVFLGKHSSIGHGITLSAADVEIFYNLGFNSDNYDQARMRAVSGGKCVLVYHLMMGGGIEETKVYAALANRADMLAEVMKDVHRKGYQKVFEEISMAELLVEDGLGAFLEDSLEAEARKVIGYDGPLDEEQLERHFGGKGFSLFATIKKAIGTCLSLKEAYKRCMLLFHPDRAVAQGHGKDSPVYKFYQQIAVAANDAYENAESLGEFVKKLGGKDPSADEQKWYDYLLRKARARATVAPLPVERRLSGEALPV